MTISKMIDNAAQCVKCGATMTAGCNCWVKLECPRCGKKMSCERDKTDPPNTAMVKALCNDCDDGGGFPDILYFDRHGEQINDF